VQARFPELVTRHEAATAPEDFELLADAVERATADMFIRFAAGARASSAPGDPPSPEYENYESDGGFFGAYPLGDVSEGGLRRYGGTTYLGYTEETEFLLIADYSPPPLADGTPGLVWKVDRQRTRTLVHMLLFDGRFAWIELGAGAAPFARGVPPTAGWPAPVLGPAFGRIAFVTGRRVERVPLASADRAFERCASRAWSAFKRGRKQDEIDARTGIHARTIHAACAREIAAWESTLASSMSPVEQPRQALFDRARARAKSLRVAAE
jgi:hypothetical protein